MGSADQESWRAKLHGMLKHIFLRESNIFLQRGGGTQFDAEGREVPGNRGYKYFGRARELPGVKELFEEAQPRAYPKKRTEFTAHVNERYYGYRDEEDGKLLEYEKSREEIIFARMLAMSGGEPPAGWTPIPVVEHIPDRREVAEFLEKKQEENSQD
jgi:pre-mRNA-splicing factor ISY1